MEDAIRKNIMRVMRERFSEHNISEIKNALRFKIMLSATKRQVSDDQTGDLHKQNVKL